MKVCEVCNFVDEVDALRKSSTTTGYKMWQRRKTFEGKLRSCDDALQMHMIKYTYTSTL